MRTRKMAGIVVALAIGVRVAAVLALRSHEVPNSTYEHGPIAANLLAGRGFSVRFLGAEGPTSQQAPVYPAIVAATYWLGGIETPTALLILELGQALLGGVLAAGVMALARGVAPDRRGVVIAVGLIAALHPTLVYAATHVQIALLAATLLTWVLAWSYRTGRTGMRRDAVATGGLLALLLLTDPILGLVAPGIFWAVRLGRGSWRRSVALAGVVTLTAAIGIAPWIVRNAYVHHELVFIKSTFGYAFWQGNCALSAGTDKVVRASVDRKLQNAGSTPSDWNRALWEARHEAGYLDDIALTKADYEQLGALSEPERSRVLFRRAIADLRVDPARYPRLCLRRLRYFLLFDETNPKTRSLIYRTSHIGLTALAVLGLIVMPGALRRRLPPTLLTAGLITLFHALTIVSARFHIPIEPLMGVWAAGILARLSPRPRVARLSATAGNVEGVRIDHVGLERRRVHGVANRDGRGGGLDNREDHAADDRDRADDRGRRPDKRGGVVGG